jgi:hypothetical protein
LFWYGKESQHLVRNVWSFAVLPLDFLLFFLDDTAVVIVGFNIQKREQLITLQQKFDRH